MMAVPSPLSPLPQAKSATLYKVVKIKGFLTFSLFSVSCCLAFYLSWGKRAQQSYWDSILGDSEEI